MKANCVPKHENGLIGSVKLSSRNVFYRFSEKQNTFLRIKHFFVDAHKNRW